MLRHQYPHTIPGHNHGTNNMESRMQWNLHVRSEPCTYVPTWWAFRVRGFRDRRLLELIVGWRTVSLFAPPLKQETAPTELLLSR